jgi:dUTP pyrophosphatase
MFHAITVKLLSPDAKEPTRASVYSCGLDLYALSDDVISAHGTKFIRTGLRFILPAQTFIKLHDTSALAGESVFVRAGIIDSDFQGEVKVLLHNANAHPFIIDKHFRICQAIIQLHVWPEFNLINHHGQLLPTTPVTQTRGTAGFGALDPPVPPHAHVCRSHIPTRGRSNVPANQPANQPPPTRAVNVNGTED